MQLHGAEAPQQLKSNQEASMRKLSFLQGLCSSARDGLSWKIAGILALTFLTIGAACPVEAMAVAVNVCETTLYTARANGDIIDQWTETTCHTEYTTGDGD